jgi:hypothetical protein
MFGKRCEVCGAKAPKGKSLCAEHEAMLFAMSDAESEIRSLVPEGVFEAIPMILRPRLLQEWVKASPKPSTPVEATDFINDWGSSLPDFEDD